MRRSAPKLKQTYMTAFYNFTRKIETTYFVNFECPWLYCVCLVYLFSYKIKLEIYNVKKSNSKCTNFTITN